MEPKEISFEFPRGDTCPIEFELTDSLGNEVDLKNAEIYFTLKSNYNTPNFILQKKYSNGDFDVNKSNITMLLSHEDTANLNYGKYVYDISFKSGDYVKTLAIGEITLTKESTFINNE